MLLAILMPQVSVAAPAPDTAAGSTSRTPAEALAPLLPPVNASADYQLGGAYRPARGVTVVTRDQTDAPAARGRLTMRQNAAYAALLSARAHALGLAIAQKNDTDMLALRATTKFDVAVTEECQVYGECTAYTRVYGRHVIEIEYSDSGGRSGFAKACAARGSSITIVYRDRNLVPRGTRGYVYAAC